jgi:hypothetical protein
VQIIGHLAAGALAAGGGAKLRGVRPTVLWVLVPGALGGITPDLVDKAILALELSRYGRTAGHSLVFLAAITMAWAGLRAWRGRSAAAAVGFWVLGVGTHLLVDLADDGLRGLIHGGQAFYTFFAWPFATPYAWTIRNPHALEVWPWAVTPLEVVVLVGAGVWLAVAGWRAWWRWVGGGVAPETSPMP